jgi:serine/threonine protein kinase
MTRQAGGCENERLVEDYASGKLSDEFVPLFEQHLDICSHCERLVSEAFQKTEVSRWSELIGGNSQSGKISLSTRNWSPDENSGAAAQNSTQNGDSALARYRKIRIAGAGGTGVVWEAWDTVMHRAVAIKILKPEYVDFHHTQRLLREAMAQARLSHAHLAAVHEFAEIDGQPAIVMDYVPGPTLSRCLQGQPIAESLAISLLIRMTSAIEHAHNAGIIHRDLKPSNIILRSTTPEETPAESLRHMEVKVLDFGTARFTDRETVTYAGQILGTPSYMSPEQVAGDSSLISERTDIYGLGAILYELLTGRLPFTSDDPPITLAMIRDFQGK